MFIKNQTIQKIISSGIQLSLIVLLIAGIFTACQDEDIPGVGEIPDKTPPSADFSYSADTDNHLIYNFNDLSISNTTTAWNFGDGNSSDEKNPTHTFATEGIYTVMLVVSDDNNVTSETSQEIEILIPNYCYDLELFIGDDCDDGDSNTILDEVNSDCNCEGQDGADWCDDLQLFIGDMCDDMDDVTSNDTVTVDCICMGTNTTIVPVLINPSFDIEGMDSYRDGWRNPDLGGVIQVTSDPVHTPEKAAKLPNGGDRIGYQLVEVSPNTEYTLSFYYTMKTDPGTFTVRMLGGEVTDPANIETQTLAMIELTDQNDPDTYVFESLTFNTGSYSEVAIFFQNTGVEVRIDTFSLN